MFECLFPSRHAICFSSWLHLWDENDLLLEGCRVDGPVAVIFYLWIEPVHKAHEEVAYATLDVDSFVVQVARMKEDLTLVQLDSSAEATEICPPTWKQQKPKRNVSFVSFS